MRVISKKALRAFWTRHPDAEGALKAWYATAKAAQWETPHDVKADYPSADPVGKNRMVFDICNNRYRLVARILYQFGQVHVRFVGTHSEYDDIDVRPIHTEADYRAAMARLDVLADSNPSPGTPAGDELEVLGALIEQYEDEHDPIALPTLGQALAARTDALTLSARDLDRLFGGSGHRSDVLAGKRTLSKAMAARLREIGVPDAVLLWQLIGASATRVARHTAGDARTGKRRSADRRTRRR